MHIIDMYRMYIYLRNICMWDLRTRLSGGRISERWERRGRKIESSFSERAKKTHQHFCSAEKWKEGRNWVGGGLWGRHGGGWGVKLAHRSARQKFNSIENSKMADRCLKQAHPCNPRGLPHPQPSKPPLALSSAAASRTKTFPQKSRQE